MKRYGDKIDNAKTGDNQQHKTSKDSQRGNMKRYGDKIDNDEMFGSEDDDDQKVDQDTVPNDASMIYQTLQTEANIVNETFNSNTTTTKQESDDNILETSNQYIKFLFMLIFGILAFIILSSFLFNSNVISSQHSFQQVDDFLSLIDKINNSFPEQYPTTIKLFKNVGKKHLMRVHGKEKRNLRPLSFLLAGYKKSGKTVDCFLRRLAEAFTTQNHNIIQCKHDMERQELDKKIISSLKGNQKFTVIKDIETLHFKTAQLFMAYSDSYSDVSTYPQSLIILTTELPFTYDPSSYTRIEDERRVADYFINALWKGQGPIDSIAPLWSRVGDGLALLKESKQDVCGSEKDDL